MDFNFPHKIGTGIKSLIPHASPECLDIITQLLIYDPDKRISARKALMHPFFIDIRETDKPLKKTQPTVKQSGSPNSKSKILDESVGSEKGDFFSARSKSKIPKNTIQNENLKDSFEKSSDVSKHLADDDILPPIKGMKIQNSNAKKNGAYMGYTTIKNDSTSGFPTKKQVAANRIANAKMVRPKNNKM